MMRGRTMLPAVLAIAGGSALRVQAQPPAIVSRASLDGAAGIAFHATVDHDTIYVGQQLGYQVAVFVDDETRFRLRRNPEFLPPEPRGMVAYDLPSPSGVAGVRTANGRRYEAHMFQRAFFPLAAGTVIVPSAQLSYALPLGASFWSREESHVARAESLEVVVLPPPEAGRPADFGGAVGVGLRLSARLDSGSARVGDPIRLTIRVTGAGNLAFIPRPAVAVPWASVVPTEDRVALDTSGAVVHGEREFDYLLTPRHGGAESLPAVRYPFWDSQARRYDVAIAPSAVLDVSGGALARMDTATAVPGSLPLRREFRASLAPPVTHDAWFWLAVLVAPLPWAWRITRRRPRRRRATREAAEELRRTARRRHAAEARELRRLYATALAERLALAPATLASAPSLARALRRAGVTKETARAAAEQLAQLDGAAYAPGGVLPQGSAQQSESLVRAVSGEARPRAALLAVAARRDAGVPRGVLTALLLIGVASAGGAALAADAAPTYFRDGAAAYGARHFSDAEGAFSRVVSEAPNSPDAWANLGTAAWEAADTARAVQGWQRALRLEPLAEDVRVRLEELSPAELSGAAAVPPVPAGVAGGIALALWFLFWGRAFRRRGGRGALDVGGGALLALLASSAGVTFGAERARVGAGLGIVSAGGAVRAFPALGAEMAGIVATGEIARATERVNAWTRVRFDDGREGWIESGRLLPLAGSGEER